MLEGFYHFDYKYNLYGEFSQVEHQPCNNAARIALSTIDGNTDTPESLSQLSGLGKSSVTISVALGCFSLMTAKLKAV